MMIDWIVSTHLYEFFYNILIGLANLFPGASIALAVILLTIIVKLALVPLTYRSIKNQIEQKKLQPLLKQIKRDYPDKQEQSQKIMELYREHKTNPFAGCFLILIQLPIIFALYVVFLKGLEINPERLYQFIQVPESLHTMFFGIDLAGKSIILAVLAGFSQFIQIHFSPALQKDKKETLAQEDATPDLSQQMTESMQSGMKYTMPVMIGIFAYVVPAAVALYWVVSNIFTIIQELVIRKNMARSKSTQ